MWESNETAEFENNRELYNILFYYIFKTITSGQCNIIFLMELISR